MLTNVDDIVMRRKTKCPKNASEMEKNGQFGQYSKICLLFFIMTFEATLSSCCWMWKMMLNIIVLSKTSKYTARNVREICHKKCIWQSY